MRLQKHTEIKMTWSEPCIAFRVTFSKITTDYDRLTTEQKKILLYLLDNERITRKQASELLSAGETKSKTILKSLLDKKLIIKVGKARNTYYILQKQ